jgi:hypothetical protein
VRRTRHYSPSVNHNQQVAKRKRRQGDPLDVGKGYTMKKIVNVLIFVFMIAVIAIVGGWQPSDKMYESAGFDTSAPLPQNFNPQEQIAQVGTGVLTIIGAIVGVLALLTFVASLIKSKPAEQLPNSKGLSPQKFQEQLDKYYKYKGIDGVGRARGAGIDPRLERGVKRLTIGRPKPKSMKYYDN